MSKKHLFALLAGIFISLLAVAPLDAQSDSSAPVVNSPAGGARKFFMPGNAIIMFQHVTTQSSPSVSSSSFTPVGMALFPLVKLSDRLFLDAGINFGINSDGSLNAGLIEMEGFYRVNPYLNIFFGNFAPHFGIYAGFLDDFTNRFGTGVAPVGMAHGPMNQNGVGIQGGIQAGYTKFTYQLYVSNGPQLVLDNATVGSGNMSGEMNYGTYTNFNKNKTYGWHIGWLPFSNSCLELTFSGVYAPSTDQIDSGYGNVSNTAMAFGLNYYHTFNPIMVRLIAEYDMVSTTKVNYTNPDTTVKQHSYTFDNNQNGWFAGATLRATGSKNTFVKNLEIAGRVGQYNPPKDALWGGNTTNQLTFAATEYIKWDIPVTFEYDIIKQNGSPTQNIFSTIVFFRF